MIYRIANHSREDFAGMLWHAGIEWREIATDGDAWTVEVDVPAGHATAWADRGDDYESRVLFLPDRIELHERAHDYRRDCYAPE